MIEAEPFGPFPLGTPEPPAHAKTIELGNDEVLAAVMAYVGRERNEHYPGYAFLQAKVDHGPSPTITLRVTYWKTEEAAK